MARMSLRLQLQSQCLVKPLKACQQVLEAIAVLSLPGLTRLMLLLHLLTCPPAAATSAAAAAT
jgi:hypothetical protein